MDENTIQVTVRGLVKLGIDGISCTHYWEGTTLHVSSASGDSFADLKGERGEDGYTPLKGVDYFDGISCTHHWEGTTLYITSASGTISADLKGDIGPQGPKGADGTMIFSDLTDEQKEALRGEAGYTPKRGVDYWTEADRTGIINDVLSSLPNASGVSF